MDHLLIWEMGVFKDAVLGLTPQVFEPAGLEIPSRSESQCWKGVVHSSRLEGLRAFNLDNQTPNANSASNLNTITSPLPHLPRRARRALPTSRPVFQGLG